LLACAWCIRARALQQKHAGNVVIDRQYFVRQATTLLKFAREAKNPQVSAGLVQKAADLKSKIDNADPEPEPTPPLAPDGDARH
jgi:hypothetical protein